MINNFNFDVPKFNFIFEEEQPQKEQIFKPMTEECNMDKLNDKQPKNRTRHPFSKKEDIQLLQLVHIYGHIDKYNWYLIAYNMKGRSPRQCRERYQLFLSQGIHKKVKWTKDEDNLLLAKYEILGPRWKKMEEFFVGRNSYTIKNRFISLSRKKKKSELELRNSFMGDQNENYLDYLNFNVDDNQIQNDVDELFQLGSVNFED